MLIVGRQKPNGRWIIEEEVDRSTVERYWKERQSSLERKEGGKGRREERRKEGREEGKREGRKEGQREGRKGGR